MSHLEPRAMTFATKLRHLRNGAGLSRMELARRSGLCELSLRNYERGASIPSAFSLVCLAKALEVGLEAFDGCQFPADIRHEERHKRVRA
jgi:transcriptional regulator with XRE-family HTH domain